MADKIKGITIEFKGNATPLNKAIREIDTNLKATTKELNAVNKALKFNPTNVDLWKQKQELLKTKIGETETKLETLKKAQASMDASGVEKNTKEYRELERKIIETESQLKTFKGQLTAIGNVKLRAASEQMKQLGDRATKAGEAMKGISLAAAGVTAAIGAAAVKAGKWSDDLNTLSKQTGIGTKELQKYSAAADLVDVPVESIAKANQKLKKSMFSARDGGATAEAFEEIGVAVTNADGSLRDSEDVFNDIIKVLGTMDNETERDALAMKLLGKSASELNPLIEDQGETYKKVSETLKKYNLDFIDQDTIDKANEFNDSLDTIKLIGKVAFQQIGTELAGVLAPALEKVVGWAGKFAEWLGNLDPKVLAVIAAVAGVIAVIAPLLLIFGKLAFAISSIMSLMAVLGPAIGALAGPIGIAIAAIAAIIAIGVLLYKNWDVIKAKAIEIGKKLKEIWDGIKLYLTNAMTSIKTSISTAWDAIKTKISTVIDSVKTTISTAWDAIKTKVSTVVESIKTTVTTAWDTIKTSVTTALSNLKTTVSETWNAIKTKISEKIEEIKTTVSDLKTSVKNTFDSIKASLEKAASGILKWMKWPFDQAWAAIDKVVDWIKGLFPIDIKEFFSKIKLPHISVEWSSVEAFGKSINYPSGFDVDWYKNGGIFSSPSIIGVGEAGSEAVVPLDKFWDKMDKITAGGDITINVYATPGMNEEELARKIEQKLVQFQKQRSMAYGGI